MYGGQMHQIMVTESQTRVQIFPITNQKENWSKDYRAGGKS